MNGLFGDLELCTAGADPDPMYESGGCRYRRLQRIAEAEAAGYTVVYGNDLTLLLDLDTPEALQQAQTQLGEFGDRLHVVGFHVTPSKSGRWHMHIDLAESLPIRERVLLEAALGSDPKRAILNLLEAEIGEPFLIEVSQ